MGLKRITPRTNIEYWEASLDAPEALVDPFYTKKEIILTDTFVSDADALREFLGVFCYLLRQSEDDSQSQVVREYLVRKIDSLLRKSEGLQYTEFVAFWKCSGVSYSVYCILDEEKRFETLSKILELYCSERKPIYDKFGYSHIVSQALHDSGASRSQGYSVVQKLVDMLRCLTSDTASNCQTLDQFANAEIAFFFPDRGGKELFKGLRESYDLFYEYGRGAQNKLPDAVVRIHSWVYIIEAKHLQEAGGHQNEQVSQLIRFISFSEKNPKQSDNHAFPKVSFSYVAFMDGWYFNQLIEAHRFRTGERKQRVGKKVLEQYNSIQEQLRKNPNNYFVNTKGLRLLFQDTLRTRQRRGIPHELDGGT